MTTPASARSDDPRNASETSGTRRLGALASFLRTEAGGAIVLLAATIAALAWANSPWSASYDSLWSTEISLRVGDAALTHDLRAWVNDGLMALFFLLIGLEVRREFDVGEFRQRRRLAIPLLAALGGMLLPIALFLTITAGGEASRGWAMVMATDTAFAVGVLALVGSRSGFRLRTFLLTLVIVDDVAAVLVIAVVYSSAVQVLPIVVAVALLALMAFMRSRGVESPVVYWLITIGTWLAVAEAGIHPTVAGVAVGLLTAAYAPRRVDLERASGLARLFRQRPSPDLARQAARRISLSMSPNERLEHALHPWTSFVVLPLFALANAGLHLSPELLGSAVGSSIVLGAVLGLVVGKTLGIPLGAWIASRPWLGGSALTVSWPSLVAASSVAGIGFTMSLLIAELSYTGSALDEAKIGIFSASILAAGLSIGLFYVVGHLPTEWLRRAEARTSRPLPDLTVPVDPASDHIRGPIDAPLTLVEYGDFECPHCRRMAPVVKELVAAFDGGLRHVFRHLPLTDVHPNAALAADAAEAAAAQGRFWEMHDRLYARADRLGYADLVDDAKALGLDVGRFADDLRSGTYSERVARDVESADDSGVAGTPTFFLNEVRYRGPLERAALAEALDRAARIAQGRAELATAD